MARIGVQVADALAYAHAQGVLHRDVKPSNLLLDEQGTVWVTDFGVAKLVEEANLTASGDLVGTLRYMPPERFGGQSDARGDVYSLGMTLYELLARRPAFPGHDAAAPDPTHHPGGPGAAAETRTRPSRPTWKRSSSRRPPATPPTATRRPPNWPTTCAASSTTGRSRRGEAVRPSTSGAGAAATAWSPA